MTKNEAAWAALILKNCAKELAGSRSTPTAIPDTQDNRNLVLDSMAAPEVDVGTEAGTITVVEWVLVDYLADELLRDHGLSESDLPKL